MSHTNDKLKQDTTNVALDRFNKGVGIGTGIF